MQELSVRTKDDYELLIMLGEFFSCCSSLIAKSVADYLQSSAITFGYRMRYISFAILSTSIPSFITI